MRRNTPPGSVEVSNVVGLARIGESLDLKVLYKELDNAQYEPEQFSGLTYRSYDPKGTVVLFQTGRVICTGAKGRNDVEKILAVLVEKLKELGHRVTMDHKLEIKNMVLTKTLGRPINLAKVALEFGLENVDYEPNEFPGLVYRTESPSATFILFESGKIICTGSVSTQEAERAFGLLDRKLKKNGI